VQVLAGADAANALCYFLSQVALMVISLKRLHFVGADAAAKRGWNMMLCCFILTLVLIAAVIANQLFDSAGILMISVVGVILVLSLYVALQVNVFIGLRQASQEAMDESQLSGASATDARRAMNVANWLAVSFLTMLVNVLCFCLRPLGPVTIAWMQEIAVVVDYPSDAVLAMSAAEVLYDSGVAASDRYQAVGDLVAQRRARLIAEAMKTAARASAGPSLIIAALFEGQDIDNILATAGERFRAVLGGILTTRPDIILQGTVFLLFSKNAR